MEMVSTQDGLTEILLSGAAYRKSAILASAIELKVFEVLSGKPKTVSEVSQVINISKRSIEKLLGGLVAIGLIEAIGSEFKNTAASEKYLVSGKELYLGDGILLLKSIGEKTWSTLTTALTTGNPVALQRTDEPDAEFWRRLTTAIRPLSNPVAESLCRVLKTAKLEKPSVLDLAGGSGIFGQKFLAAFPDGKVLQVDWPGVNVTARKFADSLGVGNRFFTEDGDLRDGLWTKGKYDVVILSHFLYQESKDNALQLLRLIKSCLNENGYVIINEFCLNTEKSAPEYGLIFALSMMLQNHGGDSYSFSEYREWMREVGISTDLIYSPVPPATVVLGRLQKEEELLKFNFTNPSESSALNTNLPKNFKSHFWEEASKSQVEKDLLTRMKAQIDFASSTVSFWKQRLPDSLLSKTHLTRKEMESIPLLHKSQIRNLSPLDLVPNANSLTSEGQSLSIFRGTGGTTGKPTGVFWSASDWNAAIESSVRFLEPLKKIRPLVVWNGYNQAHVSGPAFDDIVRMLGGTPIPRHFKSTDLEAIQEMQSVRANALVITPKSGSGKGGSLEDLLVVDPDFIRRLGIRTLFVSSTPLEKDLIEELNGQGVEQIYNFYGSTEAFPTGISCRADSTTFHLCMGHLLVEVINPEGQHVKSGEAGLVVVSRIGSSSTSNSGSGSTSGSYSGSGLSVNEGTQLLRYAVGDLATFIDEPCFCGSHTPRIRNIVRVKDVEEKIKGGCERWE